MRKAGTHVPSGRSACIVFGASNGQKSPKAGLFSHRDSSHAAQLAARMGRTPAGATAGGSPESPAKPANGESFAPANPKPPSGAPDFGQLVAAYRLIDAAGTWLEKLKAELDDALRQIEKSSAFSFLSEAETTDLEHYSGGDGWVLDGWRWTYPTRHRRLKIGQLSVVADIGRPGRPAAALGVPCVLVMWSSAAHDWTSSIDTAKGFWPPLDATTTLVGGHIFQWTGKMPGNGPAAMVSLKGGAWFYIVRLTALTTLAQLRKLVVQPALALLNGTSVDMAFASTAGVMRFRHAGKEVVLDE